MEKSKKMNRVDKRIARSLSLQIYYASLMSDIHPKEILGYVKSLLIDKEINDNFYMNGSVINNENLILSDEMINYSYKLVETTINKCEIIDKHITLKLKNWDLKRIALIDKSILRLSLTEMFFFDDIPHKVSIVEGVEIAKIYGNDESSAFINGVLDSLYNDLKNNKIKL